jgi:hypothetical protein
MVGTKMKTYARIQDGLIAELLQTNGDITSMFNRALVWVDISSQPNVGEGWHFDGTKFTPPSPSPAIALVPTLPELRARLEALSAELAKLSGKN